MDDEDWDGYGYVTASGYRKKVVKALESEKRTPSDIADTTDLRLSHVSSTLQELREEDIVECLNPDRRKGRVYQLTGKGKWVTDQLPE